MSNESKKRDRKRLVHWWTLLSLFVVLFAGYMGAYYCMVVPTWLYVEIPTGGGYIVEHCSYTVGGRPIPIAVTAILSPAHQLDRRLRPDTWLQEP
jgi:hypothetical protein